MDYPLRSRLWASTGTRYTFPELDIDSISKRPAIGACFSGGGTRAMTCAMGQLRAMRHLGVIPTLRYISCVSGGSWAGTIYTYYRNGAADDDELLGPITRAAGITDTHVRTGLKPQQLAYGATESLEDTVAEWEGDIFSDYTSNDVWIYAVGQVFLERFGLFDSDAATYDPARLASYTFDQQTLQEIRSNNPALQQHDFVLVRPDRPFLIVNACFLLPADDPNQQDLLNFEYTPLTVGRPCLGTFGGRDYGGGFIEPFAFRTHAPTAPPNPNGGTGRRLGSLGWVDAAGQDRPFTLVDATGTSSSAFAEEAITDFGINRFDPKAEYWPVNGSGPYHSAATFFGDGGLLENNGIIPLIQRGVEVIIVFINTETKLDPSYRPSADPTDQGNDPNGRCDVYLPALFGYANSRWPWYYPNNQVFPTGELQAVLDGLNERRKQNQPMITSCLHSVVANSSWGVAARAGKLWVTWCYLDRCATWENALASSLIREQIAAGNPAHGDPSGPFQHFPNYKTMWQNGDDLVQLTPEQVTLLADFACDCILLDEENHVLNALRYATG